MGNSFSRREDRHQRAEPQRHRPSPSAGSFDGHQGQQQQQQQQQWGGPPPPQREQQNDSYNNARLASSRPAPAPPSPRPQPPTIDSDRSNYSAQNYSPQAQGGHNRRVSDLSSPRTYTPQGTPPIAPPRNNVNARPTQPTQNLSSQSYLSPPQTLRSSNSRQSFNTVFSAENAATALNFIALAAQCAPIPGLGAGVATLQGITEVFVKINYNREQCLILKNRSVEIFMTIKDSWNPRDENRLRPSVDRFIALLNTIWVSMDHWSTMSRFDSFINQFNITTDIEDKLRKLDDTINAFTLTSHIELHRWNQEFSEARERDSDNLGKILKNQEEMMETNTTNQQRLENFMRELQETVRKAPEPERRTAQKKLLTIQSVSGKALPDTRLQGRLECEKIGDTAIAGSGAYEIWEGLWLGEQKVALKVLRGIGIADKQKNMRRCQRQVMIWSSLNNKYILPLYGICEDDGPFPYLVSPWCSNGDAPRYIQNNEGVDRLKICLEAAYGLRYLHSKKEPIIHGGVKGSNILISDEGTALLADFGLSNMLESQFTQSNASGVNYRWMAPEMQEGELTKECDIWAWGMMVLELLAGKQPFYTTKMPGSVLMKIIQGVLPERKDYVSPDLDNNVWSLLQACWQKDPSRRPTIHEVVKRVEAIRNAN